MAKRISRAERRTQILVMRFARAQDKAERARKKAWAAYHIWEEESNDRRV